MNVSFLGGGSWLNHSHTALILSIEVIPLSFAVDGILGVGFPCSHCLCTRAGEAWGGGLTVISDGAIACSWSLGYHSVNN